MVRKLVETTVYEMVSKVRVRSIHIDLSPTKPHYDVMLIDAIRQGTPEGDISVRFVDELQIHVPATMKRLKYARWASMIEPEQGLFLVRVLRGTLAGKNEVWIEQA